jgi:eukaryotic-like serine/threonine-protein kinase
MLPAPASQEQPRALVFSDGLGDRFVFAESATGAPVQVLRLRRDMTDVPAFEFALRERAARLASFRAEGYARVHRAVHVRGPARELALVSEHVQGIRLSALLRVAEQHQIPIELNTALAFIRQLLQAATLFHGHAADIVNGLLAPERLVVTSNARVVVVEQVLCVAIEQLRYSRDRLWRELRIASCPDEGRVRFSRRSDVLSIGLVALALMHGRPLRDEDFPDGVSALLETAREHSTLGYERPLSPPLRDWLSRALQFDQHRSFATVPDASRAFEAIVESDSHYHAVPSAIERFLYTCTASLIEPPASTPPAPAAMPPAATLPAAVTSPARPSGEAPEPSREASGPVVPPAVVESEPEIVVQMLPPPGSADVATGEADAIDWGAISTGPDTVVTSADIAQLFTAPAAAEDVGSPAESVEEIAPVSPSAPPADPEPAPLNPLDAAPVAALQMSWTYRSGWWTSKWKRVAAAAVLVGLLAGGTALSRLLRPTVVTASEMGTIVIATDPDGLPVLIGGIEQGRTPARLAVTAGEHLVEVRGPGEPRIVPIVVAGGAEVAHFIEFGSESPSLPAGVATAATAGSVPPVAPAPAVVPEPTPGWGWLDVKSASPYEIRAGGRALGRTGGERVRLGEGRQDVELVNVETGERITRVAHIVAGKVTTMTIAAPAFGVVHLNAAPWAEVWIGERRVGETPLANIRVPVGRHDVVFMHPELGAKRQSISVTAGAPVRLSVDMR